jgi:hypothetical protein
MNARPIIPAVIAWSLALFLFCAPVRAAEPAAVPASVDYAWPNLTDFLSRLIKRLGPPLRVYKLTLDDDGAVDLWLQNNERPDLIDSYEYEQGEIAGPIAVKFDEYPSQAALDYHVIELLEIDFQRLPAMLARAREQLGMPDGKVARIELERGDSSGFISVADTPIWTIALGNRRHDGSVEFDLNGRVLHVDKD